MPTRYTNTPFFQNRDALYDKIFEERGVRFINQYGTTTFKPLSAAQASSLAVEQVIWSAGMRLDKLASSHYGSPEFWWVIARYNRKPTESFYAYGDTVYIPKPLGLILSYYVGD
jgi:hypothetical protein